MKMLMKIFGVKMMKKRIYNLIHKKTGTLVLTYIVYDKRTDEMLLQKFRSMKDLNISEVKENAT